MRIMGVKRFLEYSTSLTLHRGSEFLLCFVKNRWKMPTGKKRRSWLKWSKFGFYQISQHHTPSDSVQSHSDNPQAPHRHLTDTLQTPYRHPNILTNPRQLGEKENGNVDESNWMVINCLHIISPQAVSRVTQTTPRHLPDTFQTPYRHPNYGTFS